MNVTFALCRSIPVFDARSVRRLPEAAYRFFASEALVMFASACAVGCAHAISWRSSPSGNESGRECGGDEDALSMRDAPNLDGLIG
jgi:hypothetical protein